jgi:serine/threonine protein kinase
VEIASKPNDTTILISLYSQTANWILPDTPKDGRMNASPYFESNFHILSKIGTGEFAEVWNVRDMRTGEKYAIKKTKQPFLGNSDR